MNWYFKYKETKEFLKHNMKNKRLKVEVADTPAQHQHGLMYREKLDKDAGMLFKFNKPQNLKFWGLNTYIPLSIAFVSPEGQIQKISYISPLCQDLVTSDINCDRAIEANYDFFRENNIWVGDIINIVDDKDETFVIFNN